MNRTTKIALVTGTLVAVTAGGGAAIAGSLNTDPAAEQQAEAAYTDAHRTDASVTQSEAERAALAQHSGTVVESHLQDEGSGLVWEVKVDDGGAVWEVQLDSDAGNVVSDQPDE